MLGISEEVARRTIQNTTQLCPRNTTSISLNRRYPVNDRMLRYRHFDVNMFGDTMFAARRHGKSIRNYTCAQVFATDFGYIQAYPMEYERDMPRVFKLLFKEVGVPKKMIVDGARSQIKGETRKECDKAGCTVVELEKDTPAANRAERAIQEIKVGVREDLKRSGCPVIFWCYCLERRILINNRISKNSFELGGKTPHSYLTGELSDISSICHFEWYEWVKFRKTGEGFPISSEKLGRCLGPAKNQGSVMSQSVLTDSGEVLPIQTLRRLNESEVNNEFEKEIRKEYDMRIKTRYGDHRGPPPNWLIRRRRQDDGEQYEDPFWEVDEAEERREFLYRDGRNEPHEMPELDGISDLDKYINAEVSLPHGNKIERGIVMSRVTDGKGNPVGTYDPNPIVDSRVYEVMFPDGTVSQYSANIIAESLYSEVDEDGRVSQVLDEIIDVEEMPDAIQEPDGFIRDKNGSEKRIVTTKGWNFKVRWKDGDSSWIPLKDMKESYPVKVAEFVINRGLEKKPAFAWWVPHVMKKRKLIVSKLKSRMRKKTHKFGLEVPASVEEAYQIDERNGNTFWREAIKKEMRNVMVAFHFMNDDEKLPVNAREIEVHMIFDVKMDLTRKARLVAGGHKTPDPEETTYAGVITRESVRIVLTYAALHGLDVWGADILNAFVTAPTSECYYVICGPEFGSELLGRTAMIKRALYGMKSAARDFRNHLRECMEHLGYKSCLADPDLWYRKTKDNYGRDYYEYMLFYVDDCLMVSHLPKEGLNQLNKYFPLKPESVGPPQLYLGSKLSRIELPNGVNAWSMGASKYIQNAIGNVEKILAKKGMKLRNKVNTPLSPNYRPECDLSEECGEEDHRVYMSLIGILRWMVELGRIDITCEVSMMASYCCMPRKGHLEQVFHIFGYLKAHHNSRIVFDPTYPIIDEEMFPRKSWKQFYGDTEEAIPLNAPEPLGKELLIRIYVDADFAGDQLTRRSRTGYIVMVNSAPVFWYSKKQSSMETSSFGSEFIAMKSACEYAKSLRYKMRMMGIRVSNPCFIYGDNQSVLWNTSIPESMLKKKTSSVAYHYVREGVSRDEWRTSYIKSSDNPADILTKNLPAGINRYRKVRMIMFDIYPKQDEETLQN